MSEMQIDKFIDSLPSTAELRSRLAQNLRERDLLRKILRMAEQKEKATYSNEQESGRGEN